VWHFVDGNDVKSFLKEGSQIGRNVEGSEMSADMLHNVLGGDAAAAIDTNNNTTAKVHVNNDAVAAQIDGGVSDDCGRFGDP
jgi:hypothetical protein